MCDVFHPSGVWPELLVTYRLAPFFLSSSYSFAPLFLNGQYSTFSPALPYFYKIFCFAC